MDPGSCSPAYRLPTLDDLDDDHGDWEVVEESVLTYGLAHPVRIYWLRRVARDCQARALNSSPRRRSARTGAVVVLARVTTAFANTMGRCRCPRRAGSRRWAGSQLSLGVRLAGVATVADRPDPVLGASGIPDTYADAPRMEVRHRHTPSSADVDHHEVAGRKSELPIAWSGRFAGSFWKQQRGDVISRRSTRSGIGNGQDRQVHG
jgi:hypothetical protein